MNASQFRKRYRAGRKVKVLDIYAIQSFLIPLEESLPVLFLRSLCLGAVIVCDWISCPNNLCSFNKIGHFKIDQGLLMLVFHRSCVSLRDLRTEGWLCFNF